MCCDKYQCEKIFTIYFIQKTFVFLVLFLLFPTPFFSQKKRTSYFLDDRISFLQFFLHFHNPYSCAERSFSDIKNTSHCLHHYALCSSRRFASANAREISRFIQCGNSLHAVSSSVIQTNPSCSRLKQTSPCFQ